MRRRSHRSWLAGCLPSPIKGYPDGTFKPDNNVTYAEALAILIRALGYEPVISGTWPTNYLVKAANLGLIKGVNFSANNAATRGDVAIFTDNSLTVDILKQTVFGANPQWGPSGETILANRLNATPVEGVLLDSPDLFANAGDTIGVDRDGDGVAADETGNQEIFNLLDVASYKGLLGHTVKAWTNSEGKVFFIEDKTPASQVQTAKVSGADLKIGTTMLVTTGAKHSNKKRAFAAAPADWSTVNADKGEVLVVLDSDGKTVKYAFSTTSTIAVVTSVTNTSASQKINNIDLKDKKVTWLGDASKLADVAKDDVIAYYNDTGDNATATKYVINVARKVVTGKLNAYVDPNGDGTVAAGDKITIETTEYVAAVPLSVSGLAGKDVKVTINPLGKVQTLASAAVTTKPLAMVSKVENKSYIVSGAVANNVATLTLVKADGTTVTLRLADSTNVNSGALIVDSTDGFDDIGAVGGANDLTDQNIVQKSLVEYTLDSSGNIDTINYKAPSKSKTDWNAKKTPNNHLESAANPTGDWALIAADTTVFYAPTADAKDYKTLTTDTLLAATGNIDADVLYATDGVTAKAVVVRAAISSVAPDWSYGLVTSDYFAADGKRHIKINVSGAVTDYKFDVVYSAVYAMSDVVVKFKPSADGSIAQANLETKDTAGTTLTETSGTVTEVGSNYVKIDTPLTTWITSKTQVFNLNGTSAGSFASVSDVVVGLAVKVYTDGGVEAVAITYNP